ncbi:MAG: hypothetical protein R3A51_02365 [Nannocystaceae bacterium]
MRSRGLVRARVGLRRRQLDAQARVIEGARQRRASSSIAAVGSPSCAALGDRRLPQQRDLVGGALRGIRGVEQEQQQPRKSPRSQ